MKTPHPWQYDIINDIRVIWQTTTARNVLLRADTGAGKTVMLGEIVRDHDGASCTIAHRHNLVSAISCALAEQRVYHDIIASVKARRAIAAAHVKKYGHCYYRPGAPVKVCSVDTLIRAEGLTQWAAQVTLWVADEGHHVVNDNKWHNALAMFTHPNCRGLLLTATPKRADGKGLGRHADGVADIMVQAPPMRWLIDNGYLSDYDIVCPASSLHMLEEAGKTGDWSNEQLKEAASNSEIWGDCVDNYKKTHRSKDGRSMCAYGKRTIVFCTDVETASKTTAAFLAAGIPAATLTGETDFMLQIDILQRFEAGQLWVICAVDIISEGFDLPAVECVIMARPTQSLALYMQQFGRALRIFLGKLCALIIDLVNNIIRHMGPPDRPRNWSLDRREKRAKKDDDADPIRVCVGTIDAPGCLKPYPAIDRLCPYCGTPALTLGAGGGRAGPEQVEGDTALMDAETLRMLIRDVEKITQSPEDMRAGFMEMNVPKLWVDGHVNRLMRNKRAQVDLQKSMALWGGYQLLEGLTDIQMQKRFWFRFSVDVVSAKGLTEKDADELRERVDASVICR